MLAAPSFSNLATWFIYLFMVWSSQFAIFFLQIVPLLEGEQYVLVRTQKAQGGWGVHPRHQITDLRAKAQILNVYIYRFGYVQYFGKP